MKKFEITYYLYPEQNIVFVINAKDETEAIIFAKQYREGSFSVKEIK